jgi:nitrite reductase/ring-hydroxylating ferredoxin subunit
VTLIPLDPGRPPGATAWVVRAADGRSFAVFDVEGGYRVTDATCPHNQGPLERGWVRDGRTLTCPWHWYRFDLDSGACATTPQYRLATYPVLERDGARYADVGEPPAVLSWSQRLRAHARDADPA